MTALTASPERAQTEDWCFCKQVLMLISLNPFDYRSEGSIRCTTGPSEDANLT